MGNYLNPGSAGFERIKNGRYVDKSGLIGRVNQTIDTTQNLTLISRPRRFGKSFAAQMLCAYYDKTCDSSALFDDLEAASDPLYGKHRNKYDVIYLDMTAVMQASRGKEDFIDFIARNVTRELKEAYQNMDAAEAFYDTLSNAVSTSGTKFIMIIDEWDAPIREYKKDVKSQKEYLEFLRSLFKNGVLTARIFAAVYMTGILPIKKDGSQSAISDFCEFSVLDPDGFAVYAGFTEDEVRTLCAEAGMDFEKAKSWYDGYTLGDVASVYNPYSVMCAVQRKKFTSYWRQTSEAEALVTYIDMDEEGLQQDIVRLVSGDVIEVDTSGFNNDFETFTDKNDVLTLMIHLGYLTYAEDEQGTGYVQIPNEEIRDEFRKILRRGRHKELVKLIRKSDQLLDDTINCKEEAVAAAIADIHDTGFSPMIYNSEQSLRYTVKMAYISCVDQYAEVDELPSGHGYADIVFIPKRRSALPAMIIELKWNKSAQGALVQIKDRNYPALLKGYGGELLLVGINYDERTKEHTCRIEKMGAVN